MRASCRGKTFPYASVNYGVINSVYQKLQSEENNDIIAAHCNDHILHNCAK